VMAFSAAGFLGLAAAGAVLEATDEKVRSGDHAAGELDDAALSELPTGAALLTRSDDLSAGTIFARAVEGARPDLVHLVRQHVWDRPTVRKALGPLLDRRLLRGSREERIARQAESLRLVVEKARKQGRAVAWESSDDD